MTELAPGSVTTADLYRVMVAMHTDVTKALERLAVIENRNQVADVIHADHETRIRALETALPDNASTRLAALEAFRAKLLGLAIASSMISGGIGTLLGWILTRK